MRSSSRTSRERSRYPSQPPRPTISSQRPASADLEGHPDVLSGGITHMFLDADTAPAAGSSFDPVPDYQQEFLTLWGVS